MVVPCDDGLVTIFAAYLDISEPLWNDKFFFVCALLDVYDLAIFHKGTTDLNGFADVTELSCTVARHEQRVRIVVILGMHCDKATDCTN